VIENLVTVKNNINVLSNAGILFYGYGQRKKAEEIWRVIKDLAATTSEAHHIAASHLADSTVAFNDGRLEETVEILESDLAWRREVGLPESQGVGSFIGFFALDYLNGINNSPDTPILRAVLEGVNAPVWRRFPFLPVRLGNIDEANQRLDRMLESRPHITTTDDMTPVGLDMFNLESAVLVGHRQAVELLLRRFADTTLSVASVFSIARILGEAAAFLERYEEARERYQEAIRVCTEMRIRPELALSRLGLAELLLDHYPDEKTEALEHLDFAIKEFREMKMQPSLERALRRKDILKA